MNSTSQSSQAQKLIQACTDISSTEDFIIYVAGTDNMLSYCQELLEQHDRDNNEPMAAEINSLCAAHGILSNLLYSEIRKVLIALNRFHDTSMDHYETLGLQKNASIKEVKKAYRQLSKHYHPDMAQNNGGKDTQRFMEIAGAYHAIMTTHNDTGSSGPKPWRENNANHIIKRRFTQKTFFLTLIPFILALTLITFYVSKKYDEEIILSQMQSSLSSELKSAAQVKTIKDTAPTPAPQSDDPALQLAPDTVVLNTPSVTEGAAQTDPVVSSSDNEMSTLQPQPQTPADVETVEEIPSPGNTELATVKQTPAPDDTVLAKVEEIPSPGNTELATVEETPAPDHTVLAEIEEIPSPGRTVLATVEKTLSSGSTVLAEVEETLSSVQTDLAAAEKAPAPDTNVPDKQLNQNTDTQPLVSKTGEKQASAKQRRLVQGDQRLIIKNLLTEYVQLYNSKNIEHLFALYNEDATENGQLQSLLVDQYKSFFALTETVALNLDGVKLREYNNGFEARSRFTAYYTYKDSRITEHTGEITFYLTNVQGNLKIQSLDYVFLN